MPDPKVIWGYEFKFQPANENFEYTKRLGGKIEWSFFSMLLAEQICNRITKKPPAAISGPSRFVN